MAVKTKKTGKKTVKKAVKKPVKSPAKKATKKATKSPIKTKTKKTTSKPKTAPKTETKKSEIVLKRNGTDKEGNAQFSAIKVYSRKPNGWKESRGATGVPKGLKLIHNGKSAQSGERRVGFIKK